MRFLAYAVYFDHKRRTDPGFRKALKRESKRQARVAKEEAEIQGKQQQEQIKQVVDDTLEEGFPTDLEEREAYFMQQIAQGEAMSSDGAPDVHLDCDGRADIDARFRSNSSCAVLLQGPEGVS